MLSPHPEPSLAFSRLLALSAWRNPNVKLYSHPGNPTSDPHPTDTRNEDQYPMLTEGHLCSRVSSPPYRPFRRRILLGVPFHRPVSPLQRLPPPCFRKASCLPRGPETTRSLHREPLKEPLVESGSPGLAAPLCPLGAVCLGLPTPPHPQL